jgi:hypothetical protein
MEQGDAANPSIDRPILEFCYLLGLADPRRSACQRSLAYFVSTMRCSGVAIVQRSTRLNRFTLNCVAFTCSYKSVITVILKPMLKQVSILIVCLSSLFVGCTKQTITSGGPVTKSAALSEGAVTPQSTQGSATSSSTSMLPLERPLVVDVDPNAEISGVVRSVFQDSKGVLWIGGTNGLFRYDGNAFVRVTKNGEWQ